MCTTKRYIYQEVSRRKCNDKRASQTVASWFQFQATLAEANAVIAESISLFGVSRDKVVHERHSAKFSTPADLSHDITKHPYIS